MLAIILPFLPIEDSPKMPFPLSILFLLVFYINLSQASANCLNRDHPLIHYRLRTAEIVNEFFSKVERELLAQNMTAHKRFGLDSAFYFYLPNRGWHIHVKTVDIHKQITAELMPTNVRMNVRLFVCLLFPQFFLLYDFFLPQENILDLYDGLFELQHQYFTRISRRRAKFDRDLIKKIAENRKNARGGEENIEQLVGSKASLASAA